MRGNSGNEHNEYVCYVNTFYIPIVNMVITMLLTTHKN